MYWNGHNRSVRRIPVRVVESEDTSVAPVEQVIETDRVGEPYLSNRDAIASPAPGDADWQSLAFRLQAEMDNFRKRQTRRADEAIGAERERLLRLILPIADNLARALGQDGLGDESLRQGVELTYRELVRLLEIEGVTRVDAVGQPFTPELHDAVATVASDSEAGTVVEELEGAYMLGERLLRPARVIVAA